MSSFAGRENWVRADMGDYCEGKIHLWGCTKTCNVYFSSFAGSLRDIKKGTVEIVPFNLIRFCFLGLECIPLCQRVDSLEVYKAYQ